MLIYELDDAVEAMAALLEADTDPDTNLTNWADEAWRVRKVITDDLILPKDYPVIYVSGTSQIRKVVSVDGQYDTRMEIELIVEQIYREPSDVTNSKRELIRLARRVEEVARRNRLYEPYWYRSVFHDAEEPLKMELYTLKAAQHVIIGAVLMWHGVRRTLLTS